MQTFAREYLTGEMEAWDVNGQRIVRLETDNFYDMTDVGPSLIALICLFICARNQNSPVHLFPLKFHIVC